MYIIFNQIECHIVKQAMVHIIQCPRQIFYEISLKFSPEVKLCKPQQLFQCLITCVAEYILQNIWLYLSIKQPSPGKYMTTQLWSIYAYHMPVYQLFIVIEHSLTVHPTKLIEQQHQWGKLICPVEHPVNISLRTYY